MRFAFLAILSLISASPARSPGGTHGAVAQEGAIPDSILSAVREEYSVGRFWHGVRLLRNALEPGEILTGETTLLLADGEAGWGDWEAVRELLAEPLANGDISDPRAWYLLGRSLESMEEWEGAAEAYASSLRGVTQEEELAAGGLQLRRGRLARVLARQGRFQEAEEMLAGIRRVDPEVESWIGLEVASEAAEQGAREATRTVLSDLPLATARVRGWDLPALALLSAGDSAGAEAAYWSALPSLDSPARRAQAWVQVGRLRLARGDSVGARGAFHQVLDQGVGGSMGVEAAASLLALGLDSVRVARRSAELLAGAGRPADAMRAWGAYEDLHAGDLSPEVTLALARLDLRLRDPGVALERLAPLLDAPDESIGVSALSLQAQAYRALGRGGDARRVQDALVARFPSNPAAVEILFLRADALQDRGDITGALEGFQATVSLAPAQNLAGQARMRMGQIHLARGSLAEVAAVYQEYMADFPDGRRWDEAAFWAGRALLEMGESEEARRILDGLTARFPLSYYAVQAGVLLGEPYTPGLPEGGVEGEAPEYITRGLDLLDRLLAADLDEGAGEQVTQLMSRARDQGGVEDRRAHLLRLALEFNERGLTREGINLGWEVLRLGGEWDRDLLSAIYPFPYRDLVIRTAEEVGLDPFLMAGLMRQESAFWYRAVSRADARGLMQVLPTTGAELARAIGPRPFAADEQLFRPEINVHLGTAFFADLRRRFGDDLSILLSAYNAGPTRARRWREFPEAGDLTRFVERIPFTETRGYVKNVLRNREIYAWLYGNGVGDSATLP